MTPTPKHASGAKHKGHRKRRFFVQPWIIILTSLLLPLHINGTGGETAPPHTYTSRIFSFLSPITNLFSSSFHDFTTVDPSKILVTLVKHGGLLLPKDIETELLVLSKICHVEESKIHVTEKKLVLYNMTISLPGNTFGEERVVSLRVGRLYVKWDSYFRPCVEVEMDDVDILVEFTNLLLTKNNWNELKHAGFPPNMILTSEEDDTSPPATFVRIGSVDLSGKVIVQIKSRPLDKLLTLPIILDLDMLDELNAKISEASEWNRVNLKRKGCTTEELYAILKSYFGEKLQSVLRLTAFDIASSSVDHGRESKTLKEAKRMVSGARDVVAGYAQSAGGRIQDRVEDKLNEKLNTLGDTGVVNPEQLDRLRQISRGVMEGAADNVVLNALSRWERIKKKSQYTGTTDDVEGTVNVNGFESDKTT